MFQNGTLMANLVLAKRKDAIKRALTCHLAGIGEKSGLVFKSLERLNRILETTADDKIALDCIDRIFKLLPYVLEREGNITGASINPQGAGVINVQINNFDTFLKDRLSKTNLGNVLSDIGLRQVDPNNMGPHGPTFTPPPTPGDGPLQDGTDGTTQSPTGE